MVDANPCKQTQRQKTHTSKPSNWRQNVPFVIVFWILVSDLWNLMRAFPNTLPALNRCCHIHSSHNSAKELLHSYFLLWGRSRRKKEVVKFMWLIWVTMTLTSIRVWKRLIMCPGQLKVKLYKGFGDQKEMVLSVFCTVWHTLHCIGKEARFGNLPKCWINWPSFLYFTLSTSPIGLIWTVMLVD